MFALSLPERSRTARRLARASLVVVWLWSSRAYPGDGPPARRYAPRPVPLGYPVKAVPISEVTLPRGFWAERVKTLMTVSIPHVLETLRIDYDDPKPSISALALVRTLEGVAYCLMMKPDPRSERMMDKICAVIGKMSREGNRWFAGCPEAPVMYYFATGKVTDWLTACEEEYHRRREEFFDKDWRPLKEPPPHGGIEMAIVSLYMATGDEFYKRLAQAFMDSRGMPATGKRTWPKFAAQHKPIEQMNEPGGHAGSFGWFASSLVDVAALTGEKKYAEAAKRIWQNLVDTRMCIHGGTGAVSRWEGFGAPYAIGRGGYNETCAASGEVFYNYRLFKLTADARYLDVMEVVLFNCLLAGVSLDGDKFFYTNVLESRGGIARRAQRRVPCCHGSICRTIPQVPGYMYAYTDNDIYVTLYATNSATIPLRGGKVEVREATEYPFDGKVALRLSPARDGQRFALRLRIPTWARERFMPGALYRYLSPVTERWSLKVNGREVEPRVEKGFAVLERAWRSGDKVELVLPMPVRFNACIEKVEAYRGRVAVTRGPLLYCAEEADNGGPVQRLALPRIPNRDKIEISTISDGLLQGVRMITMPGVERREGRQQPVTIRLIPYYAWNNRGAKSMVVWIPRQTLEPGQPLTWHPAGEGKPPASRGGDQTAVTFVNNSGRRVKIFWVGYRGRLRLYGELAPGATRDQATYANNVWLVTDEHDKALGYFVAGPQASRAVIPPQ